MRPQSTIRQFTLGLVTSFSVASMLGCQVPGGSFGSEPLQIRFAEAVKVSVKAIDHSRYEDHGPQRTTSESPMILAGHPTL